jgi:hypothetical protein
MSDIDNQRLNAEWVTASAVRDMIRIAAKGDHSMATYDNALDMGGALYPELLGPNVSVLVRERESDITKEFRQRAEWMSIRNKEQVEPINLVIAEIKEHESLLEIAKQAQHNNKRTDRLKHKLSQLNKAKEELEPKKHTENQLIFRDANIVERNVPVLFAGQSFRDFKLPEGDILRIRVLHPDKPEHITGADVIYEKHTLSLELVSLVAVQYKIWEDKRIYLSDDRMMNQIGRLKSLLCDRGVCTTPEAKDLYRFPYCSAFLRLTDKLQQPNQKFISTGEHLPVCKIDRCKNAGNNSTEILTYNNIREWSLSHEMFEYMFNREKIGSRLLSYQKLSEIYEDTSIVANERVVIYAQEFIEDRNDKPPF